MLVDEILSSRLSDSGSRDETECVSQEEYLVWAVNHPALPSDFLKLLTQVTHFLLSCFGSRIFAVAALAVFNLPFLCASMCCFFVTN